ncbi:hypothetical protein HK414_13485 [Ramlibacter terrae]|uniref:Uncharacterized protein n=1 Tax=Ramlibacter terrae TaxID=2732511 RepID=A0ABX6P2S1_9BURK|nr:hypothetical protein HK414_13485 [Ramlibacter terrae]
MLHFSTELTLPGAGDPAQRAAAAALWQALNKTPEEAVQEGLKLQALDREIQSLRALTQQNAAAVTTMRQQVQAARADRQQASTLALVLLGLVLAFAGWLGWRWYQSRRLAGVTRWFEANQRDPGDSQAPAPAAVPPRQPVMPSGKGRVGLPSVDRHRKRRRSTPRRPARRSPAGRPRSRRPATSSPARAAPRAWSACASCWTCTTRRISSFPSASTSRRLLCWSRTSTTGGDQRAALARPAGAVPLAGPPAGVRGHARRVPPAVHGAGARLRPLRRAHQLAGELQPRAQPHRRAVAVAARAGDHRGVDVPQAGPAGRRHLQHGGLPRAGPAVPHRPGSRAAGAQRTPPLDEPPPASRPRRCNR